MNPTQNPSLSNSTLTKEHQHQQEASINKSSPSVILTSTQKNSSTTTSPVESKSASPVLLVTSSSSSPSQSESSVVPNTDIEIDQFVPTSPGTEEITPSALIGQFMDIQSIHPVIKSFLIGSISGTCSTVLFQPLDLLKTRIQAPPPTALGHGPAGIFTVAGNIVRHEKIYGLWKGMVPSLTRCVPGVGLYFASIHGMKIGFHISESPSALESMVLGATARCMSSVVMIPFTVIKTRFESKVYKYGSISEALRLIYRNEGIHGLTCGLLPTLLRDAPFSGLYLMMYTTTKGLVPGEWMDSNTFGPSVRFSCGIVAGFGASLITQPADVIKTKMQLFPDKFQSVPPVIKYVYQKYGIQGYFKGLMPRMVRRTLVAAMSWTVYEQMMKHIGLK